MIRISLFLKNIKNDIIESIKIILKITNIKPEVDRNCSKC
jgi:hypothetical protein